MPARARGFTLIELLVVIVILAILGVVGTVVFTNTQKGARDARRKADVESISKAFETKYSATGYVGVEDSDFSSGQVPKDPRGDDYYIVYANDGTGYRVCASLDNNSQPQCGSASSVCFCANSSQGQITDTSSSNLSGTGIGLGYSNSSSCNPSGSLQTGLVGYWPMDEASWNNNCSADTVSDASGTNTPGKSCPSGTGPTGGEVGNFGRAGLFDGVTDNITILDKPALRLQAHTIAMWIKSISGSSAWMNTIHKGSWGPYANYSFQVRPSSNVVVYIFNNSAGTRICDLSLSTPLGVGSGWHLLVGTYNGTTKTLYVDGQSTTVSCPATLGTDSNFVSIGGNPSSLGSTSVAGAFNGYIDDVRIYNRALTGPEVSSLYNGGAGCIP